MATAVVLTLTAFVSLTTASAPPSDFPAPQYTVDLDAPPRTRWTAAVIGQIDAHGWDAT